MQAIHSTRPGGHVGFVGVSHDVAIPGDDLFMAGVHIHGGPAPVRRFLPQLVQLIWDRAIEPGKVFDLTLPWTEPPRVTARWTSAPPPRSCSPSDTSPRRTPVVVALGTGCGGAGIRNGGASGTAAAATSTSATPPVTNNQEDSVRIKITIGGQIFHATLSESPAAHDLIAQLPVTIEMADHGAVEKTGALTSPLSLEGQPDGADPDVGDLGYYAPGNDLVLYYGDQSYYPGIVIVGRLEGDAAWRIAGLTGSVTAAIETHGD